MAYSSDHALDSFSGTPSAVPSGPPWPNPLASIAYASCRPADCEPPAEDSALTSRAAYERLNRAAARAETLVLYRLDMLSGCRDSLDVDQTRLEQSIQNLWRLTAVRKTLISIEAALNAPTPAPGVDLQSALAEVNRLLAEIPTGSADVSSATAPADQSAPALLEPPLPADSVAPSTPVPDAIGSHSSYPSHPSHPSHSSHSSHQSAPAPVSSNPQSKGEGPVGLRDRNPQSLLSIGSVPACPRLSLSSAARTLDRVNADMAQYAEYISTAADYNTNVTAEEFLRPSLAPKSSPAPAHAHTPATAAEDNSPLLADPDLSPSLKSQISIRNPINPDSCLLSPVSSIPHSAFHIPHSPRPPD